MGSSQFPRSESSEAAPGGAHFQLSELLWVVRGLALPTLLVIVGVLLVLALIFDRDSLLALSL